MANTSGKGPSSAERYEAAESAIARASKAQEHARLLAARLSETAGDLAETLDDVADTQEDHAQCTGVDGF